jgi:hypothetical protein
VKKPGRRRSKTRNDVGHVEKYLWAQVGLAHR